MDGATEQSQARQAEKDRRAGSIPVADNVVRTRTFQPIFDTGHRMKYRFNQGRPRRFTILQTVQTLRDTSGERR